MICKQGIYNSLFARESINLIFERYGYIEKLVTVMSYVIAKLLYIASLSPKSTANELRWNNAPNGI